jgi:hypothetical protein
LDKKNVDTISTYCCAPNIRSWISFFMNMLKINLETKQFLKQKGFIKLLQLLAKVKVQLWDQFPKD